ncbi:hypothetical protein [Litchfieldia salsa]|uniref:Uncharacterized protein n=1 Tax=Litchfieldia salsa TaxID=930152 RepID=A0A1H0X3K0_9BACI|nr:hypothetical protein [Litchfieldia salsa]SDP97419.1 hypothetical protein SAMN05216565_1294 [Litchfieldia salsa]
MNKELIAKIVEGDLGELARTQLENKTQKLINQLLESECPFLLKPLQVDRKGFTVEQYAQEFSEVSDRVILEAIEKENLKFISGKLQFSLDSCENKMIVDLSSFFEGNDGEWIVKSACIHAVSSVLNDEGLNELVEERLVEYYITPPGYESNYPI